MTNNKDDIWFTVKDYHWLKGISNHIHISLNKAVLNGGNE